MKSGIYLLTLLLLLAQLQGLSQTPLAQQLKLPQVVPNSPDAATIEKFGNFPVTYSTGAPNISIPLWTVSCGSLSWPITLSYHASGIKVDESASNVGLGWSVQGVGVITRTVNGRRDEETSAGEPASYENVNSSNYQYLYSVNGGTADAELDIFNYSFNGKSGKFVLAHDATGTVVQIPQTNLKITHDAGLTYFQIKDEFGIVYTFDTTELTTTTTGQGMDQHNITSWYLTKVELPDKNNTIEFSYAYAGPATDTYKTYTQTIGRKYYPNPSPQAFPILDLISEPIITSSSGVSISLKKLTRITFPNGFVDFVYDPVARQDIGSNNVYNKLTSIVVNEITNGITVPVKNFKFNQSYFHHTPGGYNNAPANYRLRLDNVIESGSPTGAAIKQHTFQYNTSENMSPRGSTGQDMWGFNNGQTGNATLLQSENVSYYDGSQMISATIGNANRNVDTTKMKAWMLTSITYPTGGKTEFVYEPHVYATDFTLATHNGAGASVIGNQAAPLENVETFTYPGSGVVPNTTRLEIDMSHIDFPQVTQPSVVSLRDLTIGQDVFVISQPRIYERYSYNQPIKLVPGHQYQLKATLYSNASYSQLSASIRVNWSESTSTPDIRRGGGLRIRQMLHYTNSTTVATKEIFNYDTAVTLTPFHHISRRYKEVFFRLGTQTGMSCNYHHSPICRVYHSQSVYALTNALGSPMLYGRVEKINVNASTNVPNGKSEYIYDVFQDPNIPVGGPLALGAQWANGFITTETHYKYSGGAYIPIQKTDHEYNFYNSSSTLSLRVEPKVIINGCSLGESSSTVFDDLLYYTLHIPTGSKRLAKQITTQTEEAGNAIVKTTIKYYNNLAYDFPTAIVTTDSENGRDSTTYKYSPDFSSGTNVYNKMVTQNILAPVIEQVSYKNGNKLSTLKNNYRDWFNNNKVLAIDTVQASLYTSALETRLRYLGYDAYNNPTSMSKDNDIVTTYIWGYGNTKPIAQVTNATSSSVAYTSFETTETGGWSGITAAGLTVAGAATGKLALTKNNFSISKSGLSTSTNYTVSYWSKNGSYTVNGLSGAAGPTVNGWTLYIHTLTPATTTITVAGSGSIDELRLYPTAAHMTTYAYKALSGVISICDANNRITYYEYDELQRPIVLRDQDRNIVKKFSYNYHGVTEYPNIYYNAVQNMARYKQGCTGCQIGSLVTYSIPANTYMSTESSSQPVNDATADANANAQNYANENGTCITPTAASINAINQINNNGFSIKFHNNCTNTDYTYSLGVNANIILNPAPPIGNYNVTITKMAGPGNYTYRVITGVNSLLTTTTSDPTFTNVDVTSTGNEVRIQL